MKVDMNKKVVNTYMTDDREEMNLCRVSRYSKCIDPT